MIAEIEKAGAHVVALDTCMGLRHYAGSVEEDAPDPFLALAKRYLTKPGCARMQGFEERVRWMKTVADDAGADGIVFCSLKFCGPCIYDIPMMSERFRQLGIPFLWLEHDYEWSGLEQLRNRVEAFLELRR
jgi:benzoyl-CoA reductase/2-hydroxyglutaryl-CoA dehydratase subunit BcrC/BadD/HgdB